jgi:hypothetical protein
LSDAERPQFNGHNADAISVRDYFEVRLRDMELRLQQRFNAQEASVTAAMVAAEKAVNAAFIASEKAIDKAEQAQALRNIVFNEFRNTLSDQAGTFWPIKEGQAAVTSLSNRTDEALVSLRRELVAQIGVEESRLIALERLASVGQGRLSAISMLWGVAAVIASLGLNLLWHFATH